MHALTMQNTICSKPVLPIEMELAKDQHTESEDNNEGASNVQSYMKRMDTMRDNLFADAKSQITNAQFKQKNDYDRKHGKKKVSWCMTCMNSDIDIWLFLEVRGRNDGAAQK